MDRDATPPAGQAADLEVALRRLLPLLLAFPLVADAGPPPERLLADAARRVERGDPQGALERLETIKEVDLSGADEARRVRVLADAHRLVAAHAKTADPGMHLTHAFEAHQRCVESEGPGQLVHARHCRGQEDLLVRALADRAAGIATALELGLPAAPGELSDRCTQLSALRPDQASAPLCHARLAWAQADAEVARSAFAEALALEPSDDRDKALAQAASTLLQRLGDADGAAALVAQVPPADRGPRMTAVGTSVAVFAERFVPLRDAAHQEPTDPKAWRRWLSALGDGGLWVLARSESAVAVERCADDPLVWLTAASLDSRAAAAVSKDLAVHVRDRQIQAHLKRALDRLQTCASLDGAPDTCAAQAAAVQQQLTALDQRIRP